MATKQKSRTKDQSKCDSSMAKTLRRKSRAKKRARKKHQLLSDSAIRNAKKKGLKYLHRTRIENSRSRSDMHQAHVCIICDCFIIGTEPLKDYPNRKYWHTNKD